MNRIFIAALAFAFMAATPVMAQDAGLYDPVAPEGSVFVRFINIGPDQKEYQPVIRGKSYKAVDYGEIGPYVPVKFGNADLKFANAVTTQNLEKGGFYTATYQDGKLIVLKDEALTNPVKAQLAFYNFTDNDLLALKTADGKVEIIPGVSAGKSGYREINGVQVKPAIYARKDKLVDIDPVTLKRSEATAIVVAEKADGTLITKTVQSRTDTTQ